MNAGLWHDVPHMISEAVTIEDFDRIALLLRDVSRDHVATAVEAWSVGYVRMRDLYRHLPRPPLPPRPIPPWLGGAPSHQEDPPPPVDYAIINQDAIIINRSIDRLRDHQAWLDSLTSIMIRYPEWEVHKSASVHAALKDFENFTRDPVTFLVAYFPRTMLLQFPAILEGAMHAESRHKAFDIQNVRLLTQGVAVTVSAWNSRLRLGRISSDLTPLILGFCRWSDAESLQNVNGWHV